MRNRVASGNCDIIESAVIATMCKGEAQGLFEHCTIPNSSMYANLALAVANFNESRQQARAHTGGPVVEM